MSGFSEDQLKWYDKIGKARPTHIAHGISSDNINEHMRELKPYNWALKGNVLHAETDMGPLVQKIPPEYILKGEDENGRPQFEKVKL